MQGFLALLEPEATVRSRAKDVEIVKKAVATSQQLYKQISGRDLKATVDASLSNAM